MIPLSKTIKSIPFIAIQNGLRHPFEGSSNTYHVQHFFSFGQNEKKYFPKLVDCNIIRNKIFYNKLGYSGFLRKKNYSLSEVDMRETLKRIIYNLENFDEATKDFLIEKTIIKVEVIHPRKVRSISCSGNIADIELR